MLQSQKQDHTSCVPVGGNRMNVTQNRFFINQSVMRSSRDREDRSQRQAANYISVEELSGTEKPALPKPLKLYNQRFTSREHAKNKVMKHKPGKNSIAASLELFNPNRSVMESSAKLCQQSELRKTADAEFIRNKHSFDDRGESKNYASYDKMQVVPIDETAIT